jgi:transposase
MSAIPPQAEVAGLAYGRIATRSDKLAVNYLAFVQLASIRLWLHVNKSTT